MLTLTFLTSRLGMIDPLLLLETEGFFSFVYMSVFTTKLASASVTELQKKKKNLAREIEAILAKGKTLISF